jgi:acetyltransferase
VGPEERWVTPQGALIFLRPSRAQDAPALGALFEGLPRADRRLRFHGAVNELSRTALERLAGANQPEHVALAAFADGSEDSLIAEARWFIDASGEAAELALSVASGWRRRGIGTRCVGALLQAASLRGLARLYGGVLLRNAPMLALMRHCGFRCRPSRDDSALLVFEREVEAEGSIRCSNKRQGETGFFTGTRTSTVRRIFPGAS